MTSIIEDERPMGFSTPTVSKLTGVPPGTLNHWVSTGLIIPEIRGPSGRRATRYWSLTDLIAVRVIRELRELGCPLQTLKKVKAKLKREGGDFGSRVLVWDGGDVLEIAEWGEVRSLIRRPDQRVLAPTVLGLEKMKRQAETEQETEARPVDVKKLERATRHRRQRARARMEVVDFSGLTRTH
jgi:DNA-binding transcriptional MerR regulator